jgi:hypothetical protein
MIVGKHSVSYRRLASVTLALALFPQVTRSLLPAQEESAVGGESGRNPGVQSLTY